MAIFRTHDFKLTNGASLANLEIAYECYGEMAADKDNVILITHGVTSSHHATGKPTLDRRRGWWNEVIGSGKLFDTDRYCIVSSNSLGSCYGSTGPASINPATDKPYGAEFPEFRYEDIVSAQHMMLRSMGVDGLIAVAGSSIGAFQVFQWAVTFPDFVAGLIALDTAPKDTFDSAAGIPGLIEALSSDPNWNGGDYYSKGSVETALTKLRINTLKSYGFEQKLTDMATQDARDAIVFEVARDWAREFDAHSLVALQRAWGKYNVENDFHKIRAKLFYVLCDTDEWFPASDGEAVMSKLTQAGVDATFLEVKSRHGHYATTEEPEKWVPDAEHFLRQLDLP